MKSEDEWSLHSPWKRWVSPDFGVLQPLWDAWKDADFDETMDADYYKQVLWHQVWEIDQETEQGRLWDEWIDVICVALNYLRMTSLTPENIGKAAEKRATKRYNGKTKEIQDKYKEMEKDGLGNV